MEATERVRAGDRPALVFGKEYFVEFPGPKGPSGRKICFAFFRSEIFSDRLRVMLTGACPDEEDCSPGGGDDWFEIESLAAKDRFQIRVYFESFTKIGFILLEIEAGDPPKDFSVIQVGYEDNPI